MMKPFAFLRETLWLALCVIVMTPAAFANDAVSASSAGAGRAELGNSTGAPPAAVGSGASRIFLDPQTGRLLSAPPPGVPVITPSVEEQQMMSNSHAGLHSEILPDGTVAANLRGRFWHFAVATTGRAGKPIAQCFGNQVVFDPQPAEQTQVLQVAE